MSSKKSKNDPESSAEAFFSSSSDEELNWSSAKFDAMKTLYSPKVRLSSTAKALDNIEKFVAIREGKRQNNKAKQKANPTPSTSAGIPSLQRNFSPSQQMVQAPKREMSNVLTYMEKQTKGPMSDLTKYVKAGSRVIVCTRGVSGERGRLKGVLVAFDKHWNLALTDVQETFKRKRKAKPFLMSVAGKERLTPKTEEGAKRSDPKVEYVGESRVRVVKTRRNNFLCERYVPQLLVRGEHVVFVAIEKI